MAQTDNRIVELVRRGEVESYAVLIRRYDKRIYNLMFRFCLSRNEAAELTQEVFCKAFEKLQSFQNGRNFFSWLYTLAMNHGRDWARQQQRKRHENILLSREMSRGHIAFPAEIVEKKQEIDRLFAVLATLPVDKREILLLRYQQELSLEEIADIFTLSTGAVKMRIRRAIDLLQELYNEGEVHHEGP